MRYIEKIEIEHLVTNKEMNRWLEHIHDAQIKDIIESLIKEKTISAENVKPLLDYIDKERYPMDDLEPMHPSFDGMKSDNKGETHKALRKQLHKEHHGLCCFCQKQVGSKFLIEHFLPQSLYKNEEVDYYNLFISCTNDEHCSHKKGNELIPKFLTHPNCENFFKYNWSGEILPNSSTDYYWEDYKKFFKYDWNDEILSNSPISDYWKQLKREFARLNEMHIQAYATIEIVGLNNSGLVSSRKTALEDKDKYYKITENSIEKLKDKGMSIDILNKLNTIKDQEVTDANGENARNIFLDLINELLKDLPEQKNVTKEDKDAILLSAEVKNVFRMNLIKNKKLLTWLKEQQAKYKPDDTIITLPEFAPMFLYFINDTIRKHHGEKNI